ncbi:MAG TPA: SigE family RNA polymerase sigma factor [Frankiaceae bacterium]|nr:SigE family RNA polymerase sigma factor [Frankiaceae bacterium]
MEDAEAAFRELVAGRGDALARTAFLLTGDWAKAEDLVQSALATTWAHWRSLREPGAAEAYTRRCMARLATSWWRRKWRGEVPTAELPDLTGRSPYDDVDVARVVTAALAQLSPKQRTVVVLRYFDDLTETDTAAAIGCAVGTVKSVHAAAIARLRALDCWDDVLPEGAGR